MSRAENALIGEVFIENGSKDRFDLAEEYHRQFPEWTDPGSNSRPIEIAEIVAALGLPEEEEHAIAVRIEAQRAARNLAA